MRVQRTVGTLALAGGLFVALAVPAMAGGDTPASMAPSAGPAGQTTMGKDGPVTAGGAPSGAPGSAPMAQAPMGKDGPVTAGGAPGGVAPAPQTMGKDGPVTAGGAPLGPGGMAPSSVAPA